MDEIKDLNSAIKLGLKFGTVTADPPWRYDNRASRGAAENHYDTMTVEEICALPVGELAAPQSHLWLWTTNAFLFESFKIFDAWGFEFQESYIWVKPQIGCGNYVRNSHEFLLLATRGEPLIRQNEIPSWGLYRRGRHSSKPEQIRLNVIEKISPGPYLELFARSTYQGWTVWGNEVERSLFSPTH